MTVQKQLAALGGMKGADLKNAKTNLVASLEAEGLAQFLAEAPPADLSKFAKLPFGDLPAEQTRFLYEVTDAPAVKARSKVASAVELLQTFLVLRLDARQALDVLTRHPGDRMHLEGGARAAQVPPRLSERERRVERRGPAKGARSRTGPAPRTTWP